MSSFLTRSLRRTLHTVHEGQIVKMISSGQNLEVRSMHSARFFSRISTDCCFRSRIVHGRFFESKVLSLKKPSKTRTGVLLRMTRSRLFRRRLRYQTMNAGVMPMKSTSMVSTTPQLRHGHLMIQPRLHDLLPSLGLFVKLLQPG